MDKIHALINEILKGGGSELVGDIRLLTSYFKPRRDPRQFNHVKLRPLTIVGFMEMGKTETAKYLISVSQEHFDEMGVPYRGFSGKTILDIITYIADNQDLIRDVNVVHVFVDDVLYGGLSQEQSKAKRMSEKIYSDVRHQLERLGMLNGILYVIFAGQRFSLIPVFFRNSPFILFKGLSIQDKYEREVIKQVLMQESTEYHERLADIIVEILQGVTTIAYTEMREDVKSITVVKPLRSAPYIYVQKELKQPRDFTQVPFNYSGMFEDVNVRGKPEKVMTKQEYLEQLITAMAVTRRHKIKLNTTRELLRAMGVHADDVVIHKAWQKALANAQAIKKALKKKKTKPTHEVHEPSQEAHELASPPQITP
ncbi:MAG: hypothetical protein QXT64_05370 [Desulfurococcaceae archaeon]